MKKKIISLLLGGAMIAALCGCGNTGSGNGAATETTENAAQKTTGVRTQPPATPSAEMEIDAGKLVTKLCDYHNVPVTITGVYEVRDADLESVIMSDLDACFANLEEVTDRKTIEKDDVAKVDYTGYMDGKEFEGGKAQDTYVKMGDGNGYIDGFTKDLPGAKVGDDVSTDVTFPNPYPNNPDMAGKPATFKFKVKGIYKKIESFEKIKELAKDKNSTVNTNIAATFASYGLTDLDSLTQYEKNYAQNSVKNQKYNDTVSAIKDYMIRNSQVQVPEEYLNARLTEYQITFENDNLTADQSLEDFLKNQYNMTLEDAKASWKSTVENQIKTELIFSLIAQKENIKLDEKEYESFMQNLVKQSSANTSAMGSTKQFSSVDDVYKYYGMGNADNGKKYMRNLFIMNKAIDKVYDSAKVTVKEAQPATGSAETETKEKKK